MTDFKEWLKGLSDAQVASVEYLAKSEWDRRAMAKQNEREYILRQKLARAEKGRAKLKERLINRGLKIIERKNHKHMIMYLYMIERYKDKLSYIEKHKD